MELSAFDAAHIQHIVDEREQMVAGYKELIPYFKENKNLNDCVEKLKMETRRYAKRQITWFKRDSEINWIYIDEYNSFEEIYSYAKAVIERGLLYG